MATFGSTPGSWYGWQFYGGSNQNVAGTALMTMPASGMVNSVSFFADANSGSSTFSGMVWDSAGNILFQSSDSSIGSGSQSAGGQHWHTLSGSPVFIGAGTQIRIGWWRTYGSSDLFSYASSGSSYTGSNSGSRTFPGSTTSHGAIGAYINYTPVYPPVATTGGVSSVSATGGTLSGTINDNGLYAAGGGGTNCYFQWGTASGSLTNNTPVTSAGGTFPEYAALTGLTAGVTYYYRAVAYNGLGTSYGTTQSFTTVGTPNAPTLTSPASGASVGIVNSGVTFTWTYNNGGATGSETGYSLQVTDAKGTAWYWTGSAFTTTPTWVTSAATSVTIPASAWTMGIGTFAWTVASTDANGNGPYASPFNVVSAPPPYTPTLLTPTNGQVIDASGAVWMSWTYNPSSTGNTQTGWILRRRIGTGAYSYWNSGTQAWQSGTNTNATSDQDVSVTGWSNGNTYLWTVATVDANGTGSFAVEQSFVASTPPTVSISSPSGTLTTTPVPTITWTPSVSSGAQATHEEIIYNSAQTGAVGFTPGAGPNVWDSGIINDTATTAVGPGLVNDTYMVYVRISQTNGQMSAWAGASFVVNCPPPATPTLTGYTDPNNGRTVLTVTGGDADDTMQVQASDDGGFTWQPIRYGVALPVDPALFTVTTYDYEMPPGAIRLYRAQATDPALLVPSAWSATLSIFTLMTMYWLADPTNPATRISFNVVPGTFQTTIHEPQTVHYALGRQLPIVVSDVIGGEDGQCTFWTANDADEANLQVLLTSQKVLMLQSPENRVWYIRVTGDRPHARPYPGTVNRYREHAITWVQAEKPK